ncbi:MAG: hypothetical protein II943_11875 [Victivallales bacterium]|nr:hypothetical protein [Victivallales bacterium]
MRRTLAIIAVAVLLAGCASKPTFIEYYPPVTDKEQNAGHGAVKTVDYRKPTGVVTVFGFSLF